MIKSTCVMCFYLQSSYHYMYECRLMTIRLVDTLAGRGLEETLIPG